MRILLDTGIFLRVGLDPGQVSDATRLAIVDAEELLVSAIARAEICIKVAIQKLDLRTDEPTFWHGVVDRLQAEELPFTADHAALLATMPLHHRDTFDRMIAAQCLAEDLALATSDPIFRLYGVRVIA